MILPIDPIILILAATTLLALLAYLREYNLRKKSETEGDEFLKNIKEKGWETLHKSIAKSQDILGQAELEGVKVVADTKFETNKMEEQYLAKLEDLINQSQNAVKISQDRLIQFMNDLQKRSVEFEEASKTTVQEKVNQVFSRLEERLSDFLVSTEQKTTSSIELELKAARNLIDTYKSAQIKLIDENILAMMEQTLSIVLGKKLSLQDQVDLVYEALEKAKIDKFVV